MKRSRALSRWLKRYSIKLICIAAHEAGHAVAAHFWPKGPKVLFSVIDLVAANRGWTRMAYDDGADGADPSPDRMFGELVIFLAGQAGSRISLRDLGVPIGQEGSKGDLVKAAERAAALALFYPDWRPENSPWIAGLIGNDGSGERTLLEAGRIAAEQLLLDHAEQMEWLIYQLLNTETVLGSQIEQAFGPKPKYPEEAL